MVCLHLFDRDYRGLFTPILFVEGLPLSFYLGQLSDFCVFGFAFLSGYAHMLQHGQTGYYKRRLKGLLSVFCSYWLILIAKYPLLIFAFMLAITIPLSLLLQLAEKPLQERVAKS